jgi:glutathione synthase/RimK-type ligase-like ATP-grasp enzyme
VLIFIIIMYILKYHGHMRAYIPYSSISTLESFFKYSDIEIVKSPEIYFSKQKPHFNFDAVLVLDGTPERDIYIVKAKLAGMPVMGINRYDKMEQSVMLTTAGIKIPDTWFIDNVSNCNDILSLLSSVTDGKRLILKYSLGARGLGQMLLTKRELIDLLDSDANVIYKLFEETEECKVIQMPESCTDETKLVPSGPPESDMKTISPYKNETDRQLDKLKDIKINKHECLKNAIIGRRDLVIQEYIPNRVEWRMLWFYDQFPIVVRRNIDAGTWQANACNNSSGSSFVTDMREIKDYGIDYDKIDDFCKSLNVPFLSIDIYFDEDTKDWGLFEFQSEFGWTNTAGMDTQILSSKMLASVHGLLSKQNQTTAV